MPEMHGTPDPVEWEDKLPGDTLQLGAYPMGENKSAPITWRVLDREDERLLVISEYGLDCRQFHGLMTDITWEACSLRKWLNGEFLDTAFSAEEQALIPSVTVEANVNPDYPEVSPGDSTEDRIFLLSVQEAELYFQDDEARRCIPTAYALEREAFTWEKAAVNGKAPCWWWLRTPGKNASSAVHVNAFGIIRTEGDDVGNVLTAIRPALWIDPASCIVKSKAVLLSTVIHQKTDTKFKQKSLILSGQNCAMLRCFP